MQIKKDFFAMLPSQEMRVDKGDFFPLNAGNWLQNLLAKLSGGELVGRDWTRSNAGVSSSERGLCARHWIGDGREEG